MATVLVLRKPVFYQSLFQFKKHSTLKNARYLLDDHFRAVLKIKRVVVQLLCPTLCDSMNTRLPCLSLSPWVFANLCPLSQWCHLTISSSVAPFFSCPQSFPSIRSFRKRVALKVNWDHGCEEPLESTVKALCIVSGILWALWLCCWEQ